MPSRLALVTHVLFAHAFVPGQFETILSVAWTLAIEGVFYILVPVAAHLVRRRQTQVSPDQLTTWIIATWIASAALMFASTFAIPHFQVNTWQQTVRFSPPMMLCLFCPGMIMAVGRIGDDGRPNRARRVLETLWRHPLACIGAALLLVAAGGEVGLAAVPGDAGFYYQALAIASALALAVAVDPARSFPGWSRPLAAVGLVSYGVYLWHGPLMIVGQRLALPEIGPYPIHWLIDIVIYTALTLPVAAFSWYLVEKPAMSLAARAPLPQPHAVGTD